MFEQLRGYAKTQSGKRPDSRIIVAAQLFIKTTRWVVFINNGRGDMIRTRDILVPNQALYQTELRPDYDTDYISLL